ncbi:hypothetical protein [Paenibacillus macquariensis]|uniref:hypothetical protein n=1 Tax=Paenibacillus macquariensis TaxID=948756 RepID=UPI0012E769F2|nr:hypothetical protein [Paenibacillus macquariensis]MEC0090575.1 hypothetical protein [Paenibacillus macquariensis]
MMKKMPQLITICQENRGRFGDLILLSMIRLVGERPTDHIIVYAWPSVEGWPCFIT